MWVSAVCGLWVVACGGGDDDGSSGGGSYSDIANSIAKPTGTLAASNAASVATEFESIGENGAPGGSRTQANSGSTTQACTYGGNISISASGSQSGGTGTFKYNNCCYTSANCCFNGDGNMYYSTQQGAGSFSYCAKYNIKYSCAGQNASINYSGCFGTDGKWTYVVTVGGKTFAVNGNYSNGSGTLEITGSNGKYTCTYSNGTGSCTGSGGNFSF
jgi:hypothetical protein